MVEFWFQTGRWPMDPSGYVFLARAVLEIGRAMFGAEWTGDETIAEHADPVLPADLMLRTLPDQPESGRDRKLAHELLRKYRPEIREPATAGAFGVYLEEFPPEQWSIARDLLAQKNAEARQIYNEAVKKGIDDANAKNEITGPKLARLHAVKVEIVKRCESGDLQTAYRPSPGGAMVPMRREWWNTDDWHPRFWRCEFEPSNPFEAGYGNEGYCKIFITRESLNRFLLAQPFSAPLVGDLGHLSPYLKTMLAVVKKLKVTPDNQLTKLSLEAEIRTAWTGEAPLSERLTQAMATLIREPESQGGRAKKRK